MALLPEFRKASTLIGGQITFGTVGELFAKQHLNLHHHEGGLHDSWAIMSTARCSSLPHHCLLQWQQVRSYLDHDNDDVDVQAAQV